MKIFSDDFRDNLRKVRQTHAIVTYQTNNIGYLLTTENKDNIITETSDFLSTENSFVEILNSRLLKVNPMFNIDLFKTTCKYVEIETMEDIPIGTKINVKIGVKVNGGYEYLNYGNYIIKNNIFQVDKKSYKITAYDKMIESMIKYDDSPLSITYPIKHKDLVIEICKKFNWNYDLIDYPNFNKDIVQDFYKEQNLTYRDILDDLNGVCGGSFMFDTNNKLIWKRPTETNEIVEDNDLRNTNVDFSEKFGVVNALTITTNKNVVLDSKEDSESISQNGKTEFNIDDNYILNYSTEDFIDEIFNEVNGLEYYLYDIDSTGLLIFEPLDIFTFRHNGVDYKTIMFNDDIKMTSGLVETTYAERLEQIEKDYKTTDKNANKLNNALISLDKVNAEIVLKVNSDGKIAQTKLSADADKGSLIEIQADNINLNGVVNGINNKTTTTINGNKITTGTITASQVSTDIITTTNFSAQKINADNITTGTLSTDRLSSNVITTNNFSAQKINADNITTGTLKAGSIDMQGTYLSPTSSKIAGMNIQSGIISNNRMSLNTTNGIVSVFNSNGGSMILSNAVRLCATAGVGIYSNSNGNLSAPPKNIDLKACSGAEVYLACLETADALNEKSSVNCTNGILKFASSGYCTYNGATVFGSSSKATKKNIIDLTQEQKDEVYTLLKNIPLKQYDYKEQYGKPFNYGFIIEDIEDTKLKDLLHITQANNKDIKMYSTEDLVRLQLVVIQELMKKIEKLENKIKGVDNNG